MPQIQEYLPEVGAQGPVGGVSPNIELAGAVGRGIQQVGAQLEVGADLIHRRQAQQETADVFSAFSEARANYTNQVQQGVQDGSLDMDKLTQQYDDETQKIGDNLSTPEGRNFFERQQGRLKGHLMQLAARGQAVVAANEAKAAYKNAITSTSSSLEATPWAFEDAMGGGAETVDELVKNGGLPEKMRDQAMREMGAEYSKGAIRGWADLNPDKARQMLQDGKFDQYLNSDQKKQMRGEIDHIEHAKSVEKDRQVKAVKDAQKEADDQFMDKAYAGIEKGSLSAKDVLKAQQSGQISWQAADKAIRLIDVANKRSTYDPRKFNNYSSRISSGEINADNFDDKVMPAAGHGLDPSHINQLRSLTKKENAPVLAQENALFKSAASSIRFHNPLNPSQWDANGEKKLAEFKQDYLAEKAKDPAKAKELLNPKNPDSYWNKMRGYQLNWQDQFNQMQQERKDKALGLKPDDNGEQKPKPDARKPNESPGDYLKRMGLGG